MWTATGCSCESNITYSVFRFVLLAAVMELKPCDVQFLHVANLLELKGAEGLTS